MAPRGPSPRAFKRIPAVVILAKKPNAEPLVKRAMAALEIGLIGTATRDLTRAAKLPPKAPYVKKAKQELAKLHKRAGTEMQKMSAKVEKVCSKPLVDCKLGKKPGTFCSHDVIEQVADLKRALRSYYGFQEVRAAEGLLKKLRPLPGYEAGNQRTGEIRQIELAKEEILSGKYWPAFKALRHTGAKSKDEYVKDMSKVEMAWLRDDLKAGIVIKMGLKAELFKKQQSQKQMDILQQARDKRESDPNAACKLYQKLIDEHPRSSASKLAKKEMAEIARR